MNPFFELPILGNPQAIIALVPVVGMMWFWIKTPLFVTAGGKRVLLWLKLIILGLLIFALMDPQWPGQVSQETGPPAAYPDSGLLTVAVAPRLAPCSPALPPPCSCCP